MMFSLSLRAIWPCPGFARAYRHCEPKAKQSRARFAAAGLLRRLRLLAMTTNVEKHWFKGHGFGVRRLNYDVCRRFKRIVGGVPPSEGIHRMMQRVLACVVALAPAWLSVQEAIAADRYPDRPIRMIVTFPPGGSTDIIARAIGPSLTAGLGQSIIIDNRPGAGGTIGIDAVAKAAPDGYVIGIGAAGALAVNVSLQERMPYDPLKDLEPVSLLAKVGFVLIAEPSFAAHSVSDVVTAAKANRGGLVIGHGGNGTAMHLSAQLFNHLAAVSI